MLLENKKVILILFGLFLLLILSGCGSAPPPGAPEGPNNIGGTGTLKQTIFSPLGDELQSEEATYSSGTTTKATNTIITTRYRDFGLNYDSGTSIDAPEPYCRIGGPYTLEVYNDARPGGGEYKNTVELYYCSSTKDMIDKIKIPNSWTNNQLTLYCNDGANINFENINFDILTSNLNTYKVCILKNLDLTKKNTIIYGFEVGNKVLDDKPGYLFDKSSGNGQIVKGLTLNEQKSNKNLIETKEELIYFSHVDHNWPSISNKKVVYTSVNEAQFDKDSSCPPTVSNSNGDPILIYNSVGSCDVVTNSITTQFPNLKSYSKVSSDNGLGQSVYKVIIPVNYEYSNFVYNNDKGESLIFEYDEFFTFYSLRDLSEELTVPIKSVFKIDLDIPNFDLSRVALLRKFSDGRLIYGYESPAKKIISNVKTTKPIYRIKIKSFSFTDNDCFQSLASYGAKIKSTYPSATDTVVCKSGINREIFINSDKVNSMYGTHSAFNLFKNVILDME